MPAPILADATVNAVWLSLAFYLLYLLVPMIPAVVIYRLFPEGKTGTSGSVEGNVGGWKIKAVGAWGAYITAFLLGYWALGSHALELISQVAGRRVWGPYEVQFNIEDEKGQPIVGQALDNLQVTDPLSAVELERGGTTAKISSISDHDKPPAKITVILDGYQPQTIYLGKDAQNPDASEDKPINVTLQARPPRTTNATLAPAGSTSPPPPTAH